MIVFHITMTSTEKSSPGVEFLERYYESDPDDSGKENIESKTLVTKKPWQCDGKGKYKEEFERLLYLVLETGKADTVSSGTEGRATDSNNSILICYQNAGSGRDNESTC